MRAGLKVRGDLGAVLYSLVIYTPICLSKDRRVLILLEKVQRRLIRAQGFMADNLPYELPSYLNNVFGHSNSCQVKLK